MPLQIAIQMEPLARSNRDKSTSFTMVAEAVERGHSAFLYNPETLTYQHNTLCALGHYVTPALLERPDSLTNDMIQTVALDAMDVLLMRQDPPFDMAYITAAYLLEQLPPRVWVINNPAEVRNHPEKLFPLQFPEYTPPTLITHSLAEIQAFHETHGTIILKPLYAFGGAGITRIKAGDSNLQPIIEMMIQNERLPVIAQAYLEAVEEGDIRVLLLDGEIMGAFRRVPAKDQHRANLSAGGRLEAASLTRRQMEICAVLKPVLQEKGLFLTGIDIIGDYLTEINVTSPMGFAQLKQLGQENPAGQFWDAVEALHAKRRV